ncbi:uncharacterized protein LOC144445868 [Glandiceps talaboti]
MENSKPRRVHMAYGIWQNMLQESHPKLSKTNMTTEKTTVDSLLARLQRSTKHGSTVPNLDFLQIHTSRPKTWSYLLSSNTTITIHDEMGDSNRQGQQFGFLKPHNNFVVPNIAHIIWFTCHPFQFENLVSILSIHRIMRPEKILFHTDCEPVDRWWQQAKDEISTLEVHNMTRPMTVFDKKLNPKWPEHSADVARLQILMEWGGVYFDTDIFVLAPLEPLRYYDYVVGRPSKNVLNNGVILASKKSKFLDIFYQSYKQYHATCYSCDSVLNHHSLAMRNINLVHIEPNSMIKPPYTEWKSLFLKHYNWKEGHFTIHVWLKMFRQHGNESVIFNDENIKTEDTTFGEMCRYIYYGSLDPIS